MGDTAVEGDAARRLVWREGTTVKCGIVIPIARQSLQLPPSLRFPPLSEGNRVGRVGSVPPASRGNLQEGVSIVLAFVESALQQESPRARRNSPA